MGLLPPELTGIPEVDAQALDLWFSSFGYIPVPYEWILKKLKEAKKKMKKKKRE